MSSLQHMVNAVETSDSFGSAAVEYKKGVHLTGLVDQYEECMLALVFLRCQRRGLVFQLSANNSDAGLFDDMVLVWRAEGHPKAHILLIQLRRKTSARYRGLHRSQFLSKSPQCDFGLTRYYYSYREGRRLPEANKATFVLVTNACLGDSSLDIFVRLDVDRIWGLDLLHAGGALYKLNPDNQDVWQAVDGDISFMDNFYLLCNQRNSEEMVGDIHRELEELLSAGDLCGSICDSLFKSLREWKDKQSICLTRDWSKWQEIVDEYIRKEVTMCSVVTTGLEYCNVADVRDYIESCNPAWVRPPERGIEALSATKVAQAIAHNTHIMVPVKHFRVLRNKILRCWGPFCQWLVIVDDDGENNSDVLCELLANIQSKRRLVIVSWRENNCFIDTFKSSAVSNNSWNKCLDVSVRLNGDQYECRLQDLVAGVDAIKALLDGKPALFLTLAQVSQPLRMGQNLEPLPQNYTHRKLLARWEVTEDFFSTLGRIQEDAIDKEEEQLEALDIASNILIVEGRPGLGASTMLSHVAKQIKERDPACWLLRVNLLQYCHVLNCSDSAARAAQDVLMRTVFNANELGRLEYALLSHVLQESPRVVCLVDGFDEVCPDYSDICLEMLPLLAPRRGQLMVTTKPQTVRLLEDRLGVLAYSMEPFSDSELEKLFKHRTLSGLNKSIRNLLRMPLFAKIFEDLSQETSATYNIVTLYEAFFQRNLIRLYVDKWGDNISKPGNKREIEKRQKRLEEQLMVLAASVLLPNMAMPPVQMFDSDELMNTGIVYEFTKGKPDFLHRTFAEHFLAKWCFLGDGQQSRATVYHEAYANKTLEFFLESFDRRAVTGRQLLEAILDGDESKVESLLAEGADPMQTDACGRNALHLVVVYNERFPAGLLGRLCSHAEEGALSAVDDLLRWTPMRYAAEGGHFSAVQELLDLGGDFSHLGDFAPVHRNPTELQATFEQRGYRALYQHVIQVKHPLLDDKAPTAQMEFDVSLIAANMAKESLNLIAQKAVQEGHIIVHSLLLRGTM